MLQLEWNISPDDFYSFLSCFLLVLVSLLHIVIRGLYNRSFYFVATLFSVLGVYFITIVSVEGQEDIYIWLRAKWRVYLLGITHFCLSFYFISCLNERHPNHFEVFVSIFGIFVASVSVLLLHCFPIPISCSLFGKHCVGTCSFKFPDLRKPSMFTSVQCWFPIDPLSLAKHDKKATLWSSGHPFYQFSEAQGLFHHIPDIPSFFLNHLLLSRTNSYWQSDISNIVNSKHPLPIAVYCHGLYGWRQVHHTACENLASSGFVVFSIDFAPDSMVCRPFESDASDYAPFDFHVPSGISQLDERQFYFQGIDRRLMTLESLFSFLQSNQISLVLKAGVSVLDWNSVYFWGHSYGASTIASWVSRHERHLIGHSLSQPIHARGIILLDPWMYALPDDVAMHGCQCPVLSLSATHWPFGKYQSPFRLEFLERCKKYHLDPPVWDFYLKNTNHQNFCDTYRLLCHELFLFTTKTTLGSAPPYDVATTLDQLIVRFFIVQWTEQTDNRNIKISNRMPNNKSTFLQWMDSHVWVTSLSLEGDIPENESLSSTSYEARMRCGLLTRCVQYILDWKECEKYCYDESYYKVMMEHRPGIGSF